MVDIRGRGRRLAVVAYAAVTYGAFLIATLWAVAFLADIRLVPTVDAGREQSAWIATAIDGGLLLLFALQHSVMARAGFKRWLVTVLPAAAERSTYVLAASLLLDLLLAEWRPLPRTVWDLDQQPATAVIWTVYAIGWIVALGATFMIDHLDFAGVRQAWWQPRRGPYEPPSFAVRWLYAWVRHPMMLGLLIVFWATPRMTIGHALFAAAGSAYIAVGIRFEERDLRRQFGRVYVDYAQRVPAVVPAVGRPRNREHAAKG